MTFNARSTTERPPSLGIDLGFGWSTKQPTSAFFIAWLAAVAAGPSVALVAGALFGTARAMTLVLAIGVDRRDVVEARFDWLLRHPSVPRWGTAAMALMLTISLALNLS